MKVEHERILIEKEGLLSFFNWRSKALADFNATAAYADEVSMTYFDVWVLCFFAVLNEAISMFNMKK